MSAVLVTGSRGYIGAATTERLRRDGHTVYAPSSLGLDLAQDIPDNLGPHDASIDTIVHCAATRERSGPGPERWPAEIRLNVDATARLYDWGRAHGVRHLLHVSSVSVLADSLDPSAILDEDAPRVALPGHPYALTKLWGEELAVALRMAKAFETVAVVRPSSVYGPDHPARGYMRQLGDSVRRGSRETITIGAPDGWAMTPVFLDDVVDVMARLVAHPQTATLNVGGPDVLTQRAMIADLAEWFAAYPSVATSEHPAGSMAVSSARADAIFPLRTRTTWKDGLRKTWGV